MPGGSITQYAVDQLGVGWYLDWRTNASPPRPDGVEYAQMIRVKQGVPSPDVKTIAAIARSVPGSLWLVGNEPDRTIWQDDATPVQYASAYHQAYQAIKQADPTAMVAIGGVLQPTPLRLRYLDAVLAAYQKLYGAPMPPDENRLVQRWCWYSLADTGYPTGNLFDSQTFQMTPLGEAWRAYGIGK